MPDAAGGGDPSCSGGAAGPATRTRSIEERNVTAEAKSALAAVSDDLAAAVERVRPSVVAIHARTRIPSSGVLWRAGVVVTADHTVKRDEDITITLHGGRSVAAQLAGRDGSTDLALLTFDAAALGADAPPPAPRGDAAALRVGELVLAVGRPGDGDVTASLGVVSAVGPAWRTWRGGEIDRFVRLDLSVYDGFSGGPAVTARGEVVGVNSSGLARGSAITVPAATVERVAERLLRGGRGARGDLGAGMQSVRLPARLTASLGLTSDAGLIVLSLDAGAPADRAGLLVGDVLVAFGGAAVREPGDVLAMLEPDRVGQTMTARVVRAGALADVPVTVGERPRREG
jgi:S1-C subfamily serine protease